MPDKPKPPRPSLRRRPTGSFGWLDARLLHERWLAGLGPDATAALTLLALPPTTTGASYWSRARMAQALRINRRLLDAALQRLLDRELVAHRPWRIGHADGVWQLLPLPDLLKEPRDHRRRVASRPTASVADILRNLGLNTQ